MCHVVAMFTIKCVMLCQCLLLNVSGCGNAYYQMCHVVAMFTIKCVRLWQCLLLNVSGCGNVYY